MDRQAMAALLKVRLLQAEQQTVESLASVDERTREAQHPDEIAALFGDAVIDEATFITERERDLATRLTLQRDLEQIRAALQRVEHNTFGYCVQCGALIPERRLLTRPQAALCVPCQIQVERHR
ncbi:MAG: TraR/DksA family transcriptional regulator [Chloroflexi bacterium]|nr:TraR/DksA family transcriptional regulator [Chloroflexota bacterium]